MGNPDLDEALWRLGKAIMERDRAIERIVVLERRIEELERRLAECEKDADVSRDR